ncbi:tRNA-(ms[2]io[6]A)-hydroxylase [Neptunomonas japonica]|uniref:tRNA-(Ms[2]io[6]A)-hydroxylase n=1 Tax=Neptunomonas japonica JAMM 1380 TaxID=1441457 RepID=A0A7R6PSW3_9GAMM|nr:tRNA isopentenyl-2-thiomethyl-A-37 hydroxylase MiaE [Neptunomonas japonica]BBB29795.1 tRNA-(ms[2]io[6]A)-hydroxylase [Neptunomonas japonica JAMM 1380]
MDALNEIHEFLACETPQCWIDYAIQNQDILLIDHAHCEKKAASTAMTLMFRYVDRPDLLHKMSRLAREELIHFEQVLELLQARGIEYCHMDSSGYAGGMRKNIRNHEPARLIDTLIVGAFIEARSCERFAKIAPYLDDVLAKFYRSLLKSEGRHYQDYLWLAREYAGEPIEERIEVFRKAERLLIESEDDLFRFHSGMPPAIS